MRSFSHEGKHFGEHLLEFILEDVENLLVEFVDLLPERLALVVFESLNLCFEFVYLIALGCGCFFEALLHCRHFGTQFIVTNVF